MEEIRPARRNSGVVGIAYGGHQDLDSGAPLTGHAAPMAGSQSSEGAHVVAGTDPSVPLPPPKQPFYKKRWFIISQIIMIPLGIALLFILLFPVVRAIVQLIVGKSTIDVQVATISHPQNGSFQLQLQGNVAHTGPIPAKIQFTQPVNVSWVREDKTQLTLGHMELHPLSAKGGRANINDDTTFFIDDQQNFAEFSGYLITSQNFTWRLHSTGLRVNALKFPVAKGIKFDKFITLNGLRSFDNNVVLKDLKLPSDNPGGGINFEATTELTNPSAFALNLGTVVFSLAYKGLILGKGTSVNTAIIPGANNIVLSGVLEPQTRPADLALVSELFTNYLNGETSPVVAIGESTLQMDGSSVPWLSEGLKKLELNVPFKAFSPINPIQTISIGELNLVFDENSPWSPIANSNAVQATLKLPFGFNVDIGQIQNNLMIVSGGNPVVGLQTPLGASKSSVQVLGPTDTQGTINITIADTRLECPDAQHAAFSQFNAALTSQATSEFLLVGQSRAVANTSLGQITLDPIKINVPSSLTGLNGLKGLTNILTVDVQGGTREGIELAIDVSILNPSSLALATGDLTLQLSREGTILGTALLPNLTLLRGNNTLKAKSIFAPNQSPQGLQTLNEFVGKKDVELAISGFSGSTKIVSLAEAFGTLNVPVTLPGSKTSLINVGKLQILPTTGKTNNISHVTVSLVNPWSAPLKISKVSSTVSSYGLSLGTIESSTGFTTAPGATTESPSLDLNMNFDPAVLFTVTRALAVDAGLNPEPLDGIVQLGGINYLTVTGPPTLRKRQNAGLYAGFNLPNFVHAAFKKLQSDVQLAADVTIGDYETTLQYTQTGVPIATDESLDLILPILAQPIVQKIVSASALGISNVIISNPQQSSFGTKLKGSITNAGPFDAVISFPSGLTVAWEGKPLGNIKLGDVKVTGDVGASIDVESGFQVADVGHLTAFTKTLLAAESFEWEISGDNITVSALGISVPGVSLPSKKVTLKGFNGLKGGVKIKTFDLPSDDPAGGIHLTLDASTANPSQVGIHLSSLGFDTYVDGVRIAAVTTGEVTLAPESTSDLSLVGRLLPQESSAGLAAVSSVFNNFVHGKDSNVRVQGASAGPPEATWLNEGIRTLQVDTVLPNRGPLDVIKSIALNELELQFTQATAYNPLTSSKATQATFQLPFGFKLDITALEQTLTVGFEGTSFAQLAIPKSPSHTDVVNRIIDLTFSNVPFAVFGDKHSTFDRFVAATTLGSTQTLHLSGSSKADALTAVGLLSLEGIDFSVDSSIQGLQGLNARPVTIGGLDVNHGFPDYLLIKVNTNLFNPSNLTIGTGDVSFGLEFQGQTLGSANLNGLVIHPGNASYATDVHFAPQGGAVGAGQTLLQNFLQGIDSDTSIGGSTGSTSIQSLKSALSQIRLSPVTIPALHQTLITSATLQFPIDISKTGIASSSFTLANPFTASLNLFKIDATATYHGILLGRIDNVDAGAHPIHADGHSNVTSPALPFKFNLEPVSIIQLLSTAAQENQVDLGPLPPLFKFLLEHPDYKPPVTTTVDTETPACVSGSQFDVAGAILKALNGIKADLAIKTSVKLDEFPTDLVFNQNGVPAIVDKTALFLIGATAAPISQFLVDNSALKITEANITNVSNDGFDLSLVGSLTNIGPLDALIEFTEPVNVAWNGQDIAQLQLPPICAAANKGVPDYRAQGHLTITNQAGFTSFATALLHEESFEWTISTPKLRLRALGTIFDNVALSKVISLKAFNNLPGVTISNFQLPSDDPAGGIHIETDSLIPSPAQLGINLGTVTFQSFFKDTQLGPLASNNLALAPSSSTVAHLSGRITPKSGGDLDTLGVLFSGFLAGENQTLTVKGDSVQPPGSGGQVGWLSEAFKTLSLEVTLPGQKFDVIQSIELNDLSVTMKSGDQAFAPPTSSQFSLAKYKNPFGFSLQVVESGQTIILNGEGTDIAQLVLPKVPVNGGVSTGNLVDLQISFTDIPLKALNPAGFAKLFAGVTLLPEVEFAIKGSADVVARTTSGDVPISGIPINVGSHLKGISSFGANADLSDVVIKGSGGAGGNEFILATLTTALQNPSNISLNTVGISLPVLFNGVAIGRAAIDTFDLRPGANLAPTEFHYQPANPNDTVAQAFLTQFIQTGDKLPLQIHGDGKSSPFPSLNPGLANLQLGTSLNGLNQPDFITQINVQITLQTFVDNTVDVSFDVHNPLPAPITLKFIQSDAGLNGEVYAHFEQPFSSFTVPPGATVNSGVFGGVVLVKGVDASLEIIPIGKLDAAAAATVQLGDGGYEIPWLHLNQKDVPTKYDFVLEAKQKLEEIKNGSTSSSAASSTAASSSAPSESGSTTTASKEPDASQTSAAPAETTPAKTPTPEPTPEPKPASSPEPSAAAAAATPSPSESPSQ